MPDTRAVTDLDLPSRREEIGASFDMRIGRHVTVQATARITPIGVISAGIAVAVMTLAAGYLVGSILRRRG